MESFQLRLLLDPSVPQSGVIVNPNVTTVFIQDNDGKNASVNFCEGMCRWCDHLLHSTSVLTFAHCCSSLIDLQAVCFIMVHMLYSCCMHAPREVWWNP